VKHQFTIACAGALGVIIVAGCIAAALFTQSWRERGEYAAIIGDANALTRELGYGGLIHNFKNALLRPDEPKYVVDGLENAASAQALVSSIMRHADRLKSPVKLDVTQGVITAYRDHFDSVRRMRGQGALTFEIDSAVRIDDGPALAEIEAALSQLSASAQARENLIAIETAILFVVFALALAVSFWFASTAMRERAHGVVLGDMNRQLEQANVKLRDANNSLQQFAGIASHDLKAPVRHIMMYASMLLAEENSPKTVLRYATSINATAERMRCLISSLLDFTKTGFREIEGSPVCLNSVAREAIDELAFESIDTLADIEIAALPSAFGDSELIRRVFRNFFANSIKYYRGVERPHIRVTGVRRGDQVVISIEDNGIGVEAACKDSILEPLQRLHASEEELEGVGIGLSVVRTIIESHGGNVWLDTSYESGARFCFTLSADVGELRNAA